MRLRASTFVPRIAFPDAHEISALIWAKPEEHRLGDEPHAEGRQNCVPHAPGKSEDVVGRRAAAVDDREGVLGGQTHGSVAAALLEAGALDEPRSREFCAPTAAGELRDRLA